MTIPEINKAINEAFEQIDKLHAKNDVLQRDLDSLRSQLGVEPPKEVQEGR